MKLRAVFLKKIVKINKPSSRPPPKKKKTQINKKIWQCNRYHRNIKDYKRLQGIIIFEQLDKLEKMDKF